MVPSPKLLVFNYVMDMADPLLSHQSEAVEELAKGFDQVTVVTGHIGEYQSSPNVKVHSTNWVSGQPISNIVNLLRTSFPIIIRGKYTSVFFHMTDVQAAILSPLIWVRRRKQFLWYAHTHKSRYLIFASLWASGILTSTKGSCPLKNGRVITIGQAIDSDKFIKRKNTCFDFNKLLHIGRFDKSKNIDILINEFKQLRAVYPEITLELIGNTSNSESLSWAEQVVKDSKSSVYSNAVVFKKAIKREEIPRVLARSDCFFHAYVGSLDKSLIEATMVGVPVVTLNPEYIHIFGRWCDDKTLTLGSEYLALRSLSQTDLQFEIDRRYKVAINHHSLKNWIKQLESILK